MRDMKNIFKGLSKLKYSERLEERILSEILKRSDSLDELKLFTKGIFLAGELFWGIVGVIVLITGVTSLASSSDLEVLKWLFSNSELLRGNFSEVLVIIFEYLAIPLVVFIATTFVNMILFKLYKRFKQARFINIKFNF